MTWQPPVQNPGYGNPPPQGYPGSPQPVPAAYGLPPNRLPIVLAGSALLMASAALVVAVLALGGDDPLGKGLDGYDMSTPKTALVADLEMRKNMDVRAQLDLQALHVNKHLDEKLASVEVDRQATYDDKQILFVSWTEDGKKQYKAEAFEKDEDSGLWFRSYVSAYDVTDEILKEDISAWEAKNEGSYPSPW